MSLFLYYLVLRLWEIVDGDGQEDVEEDVVAHDKQDDEVHREQQTKTLDR